MSKMDLATVQLQRQLIRLAKGMITAWEHSIKRDGHQWEPMEFELSAAERELQQQRKEQRRA
jgi:hypothetical protein